MPILNNAAAYEAAQCCDDPLPSLWERSDMSPCRHVSVTSEILQATLPMASMVAAVNALSELLMYVCIIGKVQQ